MDTPDSIERQIIEVLCHETSRLHQLPEARLSSRPWTNGFISALGDLGEKLGFQALPRRAGSGARRSEWLWDFLWASVETRTPANDWRAVKELALACEIEWKRGLDYLLEDFLKLTVASATRRLFIFQGDNNFTSNVEALRVACLPSKGFRYLVVGVWNDRLAYEGWTC